MTTTSVSGTTKRVERRIEHLESLDGADDGNRRCQQRVAVEKRRAHHAKHQDAHRPGAVAVELPLRQRCERQDATFAAIVGAQHQRDVFQCDDQREAPENQ